MSLILGTGIVIGLYLAANIGYLSSLPIEGVAGAKTATGEGIAHADTDRVGTAILDIAFGDNGADGAFKQASDLIKGKNVDAIIQISAAYIVYGANDTSKINIALDWLNKAKKADLKNPEIYLWYGKAYEAKKMFGVAANRYDDAILYNSDYVPALMNTGLLIIRSGNAEAAYDSYKKVLSIDSTYAPAYRELAELY